MQAAISESNNELTIRIPQTLATQVGLTGGMQVELQIVDGNLVIVPVFKRYDLSELLAGITEDNLHSEIDTGDAVGNEAW